MKIALNKVADENMCVISEEIGLPPKHSRIAQIPAALHSLVKERLSSLYPTGLYHHQAAGIDLGLTGRSLCVATPTASGKTAIFTAISTSVLLDNPGTAILALYPAKALIHDQERKWHDATRNTGIETVIIHGGVERKTRIELLKKGRIVLMTPDVLHAWLLANLDEPVIRLFLGTLKLIILDEAHIYDGVFGTNMAYLLRRLRAVSGANQVLASSATIGEPVSFLKKLTGLDCDLIGLNEDGTATPAKTIMLCRVSQRVVGPFLRGLVKELRGHDVGRFLFFVDSRKRVEELASTVMQLSSQNSGEEEAEVVHEGEDTLDADQVIDLAQKYSVLPYRAGYEETDRASIQTALTNGSLRGVISTSAWS
jgi:DEAD/DEAH box helicase domain-containing protein